MYVISVTRERGDGERQVVYMRNEEVRTDSQPASLSFMSDTRWVETLAEATIFVDYETMMFYALRLHNVPRQRKGKYMLPSPMVLKALGLDEWITTADSALELLPKVSVKGTLTVMRIDLTPKSTNPMETSIELITEAGSKGPEITKMLTVSAYHLTREEFERLSNIGPETPIPGVSVPLIGETSVVVYIGDPIGPDSMAVYLTGLGFSEGMTDVVRFAEQAKLYFIRFDVGAVPIQPIRQYEW